MSRVLVLLILLFSMSSTADAQIYRRGQGGYTPKYVPIKAKPKVVESAPAETEKEPATDSDQAIINRISRQAKVGNVQRQNSDVVRQWKEDRAKSIAETQQRKAEIANANYEQQRQNYNAWAKRQNSLADSYEHSRASAQAAAEVRWDFYQRARVNDYLRQNPVMFAPRIIGPYGNSTGRRQPGGY